MAKANQNSSDLPQASSNFLSNNYKQLLAAAVLGLLFYTGTITLGPLLVCAVVVAATAIESKYQFLSRFTQYIIGEYKLLQFARNIMNILRKVPITQRDALMAISTKALTVNINNPQIDKIEKNLVKVVDGVVQGITTVNPIAGAAVGLGVAGVKLLVDELSDKDEEITQVDDTHHTHKPFFNLFSSSSHAVADSAAVDQADAEHVEPSIQDKHTNPGREEDLLLHHLFSPMPHKINM